MFCVSGFAIFYCSGASLVFWVLARASGRKNCLVHIRRNLTIAVKENTVVSVLDRIMICLCVFLYWQFDIMKIFTRKVVRSRLRYRCEKFHIINGPLLSLFKIKCV